MNKKGFTLIELLATITIMLIIATMATINIPKVFSQKTTKQDQEQTEIITNAACIYIELNKNQELKEECFKHGCDISIVNLKEEGLIEEIEDEDLIIHVAKINNEKKCTIK